MRPPPDVHAFDSKNRPLVCKLRRSLYGLKQAGREWAVLFASFLIGWGMTRSTIDPCLYVYFCAGKILWICVYVDDALIADNDASLRDRFVGELSKRFPIEDKGELSWILNVGISRDRSARTLTMSQSLYVTDLVSKFGSFIDESLARRVDCPMEEGVLLNKDDQPVVDSAEHSDFAVQREAYMSLTGGYQWLANMTMFHTSPASSPASLRTLARRTFAHAFACSSICATTAIGLLSSRPTRRAASTPLSTPTGARASP